MTRDVALHLVVSWPTGPLCVVRRDYVFPRFLTRCCELKTFARAIARGSTNVFAWVIAYEGDCEGVRDGDLRRDPSAVPLYVVPRGSTT